MKKIIIVLLIAALGMLSQNAYAGWVDAELSDVRAFSNQTEHYFVAVDFSNPDDCRVQNTLILMRDDTNNWKMVYTLILTGFITNQKIQVRTIGCTDYGNPVINGAKLLK